MALLAEGFGHSVWEAPAVCILNPSTVIVSGSFSRYRADGTLLAETGGTYVLKFLPQF